MPPASLSKTLRRWLERHPAMRRALRSLRHLFRRAIRRARRVRLPASERGRDVITLSTLANHRWGNQFFQYVFLRVYAQRHGLRWECTPWAGDRLFGTHPSPLTCTLPELRERVRDEDGDTSIARRPDVVRNVDLRGYFQYHTSYYAPDRDLIRALCQPSEDVARALDDACAELGRRGRTLVGLHVRRSDYGVDYKFYTPLPWYLDWFDAVADRIEVPVLFVATEEPERVRKEFEDSGRKLRPVFASDLATRSPIFPWVLDFFLLTRCDLLAISNSSFSFAAAMLNERATQFVRPVLPERRLVPFDPWNSKPILRDASVEDYPEIEGIRRAVAAHA